MAATKKTARKSRAKLIYKDGKPNRKAIRNRGIELARTMEGDWAARLSEGMKTAWVEAKSGK